MEWNGKASDVRGCRRPLRSYALKETAMAAAKRACAGSSSSRDRLSPLPDEIRRHILSFLPACDVVRTTVLSKSWTDLWRSFPCINLDIRDFLKGRSSENWNEAWERFDDFTSNLLMLHDSPCLDAFRLDIDGVQDRRQRVVDRWLRRAIKCNPLVLRVRDLGFSKLAYGSLNNLRPSACRRLKHLELSGVSLGHSFAERLQSWFPDLEDLILRHCSNGFSAIHSDKLKNLVVHECTSQPADVFVIRAPGLASLYLDLSFNNNYEKGISLGSVNSLVDASIGLPCEFPPRSQAMLLGSLFSVTSLELKHFNLTAMPDEEFEELPTFKNLRALSLISCFHDLGNFVHTFKPLDRFLQKSPNLEKFTLDGFSVVEVIEPVELPVLDNLRTLVLGIRCAFFDNFGLLRHFLQMSPNLEKLTIDSCLLSNFAGDERKAKSETTFSQSRDPMTFQCPKLKSTEIIHYGSLDNNPKRVTKFLLGSCCAPKNTITFTDLEILLGPLF